MLEARHIRIMKLADNRLDAHKSMPPPAYATKPLTSHFVAIGDAVISSLLHVDPMLFQAQLSAARQSGVSYLTEDEHNNQVGLSAATSLIRRGEVMQKNVIVPRDFMTSTPNLSDHLVIGVFLRPKDAPTDLPNASEVEIAGWTDMDGVREWGVRRVPPTFKSKLPVMMVPCSKLYPIDELLSRCNKRGAVCV